MTDQLSGAGAASRVMSYAEAKRHKSSPRSRWRDVAGELDAELWPEVQPSFRLRAGETVFTIGSCFARSIEANLAALGCKVPMLDLRLPGEEWDGQANAAMNKFHPPAFRQCLEWVARVHDQGGAVSWEDCEAIAFDLGDGRFQDLDMAQAVAPVSQARFLERRQEIYDIFESAFTADCLMMTPGLIEAWKDLDTGLYAFGAPWGRQQLATPERWQFEVLSFQRCLEDMLAAIDVVRARNPEVKILITTSPVPLTRTFTGQDISIANAYSKSVLRAVCGAVLLERKGVDYFPSYEMATLSNPDLVWKVDRIHVSPAFVGKIVGHMLDHYMEGVEAAAAHYQRARTLMLGRAYDEAEAAAREALAARPDHVEARIVLGTTLSLQQRWADAEPELRLAMQADPERNDARVALAHVVACSGRTEEAVDLVEAAMDRSSFTALDFISCAHVLVRVGPDEAVRLSQRAIDLFPRHVQVHDQLAAAYLRAGRKAEAIAALRAAAALSHPPAPTLVQLAQLLIEAGERDEARRHVAAALSEDSRNRDAIRLRDELVVEAET